MRIAFRINSNLGIQLPTTQIIQTIRRTIPTGRILQAMAQLNRENPRTEKVQPQKIRIRVVQTARIIQRRQVALIIRLRRRIPTIRPRRTGQTVLHHQLRRVGPTIQIHPADRTIRIRRAGQRQRVRLVLAEHIRTKSWGAALSSQPFVPQAGSRILCCKTLSTTLETAEARRAVPSRCDQAQDNAGGVVPEFSLWLD